MSTTQNWHWVESYEDLYDFLAQVIVCAPDNFIPADYLADDHQLNLERAFLELRRGVEYATSRHKGIDKALLEEKLKSALASYREGNAIQGAHTLQEFERIVFS
ncbi:hypothetical protein [Pseudomonas subflava]|uniref:hypothetical protein n=1 Tax=Pseudomonas subflava TaxID=2952933 RepID=UPI002079D073|nr:hypothetical protein [Pseudomonas subflava]